jgi:anti-sigma factor RsiW
MNHKRIQNELSAYLDNALTASRHKQVETHLRSCNECSDMLSAFRQNRQMVADLSHPVPSTLKDAVMAKIHTQFQDELSAYLDNELAPAMHQRVEAHLHACNECTEMLSALLENRERIKRSAHPAPASIQDAVMATIRQQAAEARVEVPTRTGWLPDLGRWFFRPVTAGATGILTLALILGALYFYPTAPQYEETLDFYFGLHTEQLTDDPLYSSDSTIPPTPSPESDGDTEMFLDLYLENVGN